MSTSIAHNMALLSCVFWRSVEKSCSAEFNGRRTLNSPGRVSDAILLNDSEKISRIRKACLFWRSTTLKAKYARPVDAQSPRSESHVVASKKIDPSATGIVKLGIHCNHPVMKSAASVVHRM